MHTRQFATALLFAILAVSCRSTPSESASPVNTNQAPAQIAELTTFSQQIVAAPAQVQSKSLRPSETCELDITVTNTGTQRWIATALGRNRAAGYRSLNTDVNILQL